MTAAGMLFVAPMAKSLRPTELFTTLDPAQARPHRAEHYVVTVGQCPTSPGTPEQTRAWSQTRRDTSRSET